MKKYEFTEKTRDIGEVVRRARSNMYKISDQDICAVSDICNVPAETAMIALQYTRGHIGMAVDYARNNIHLLGKMT